MILFFRSEPPCQPSDLETTFLPPDVFGCVIADLSE